MTHEQQSMMLSGRCRCRLVCSIRQVLSLRHAELFLQQPVRHCSQDCVRDMSGRHQMQADADNNKHVLTCRMIIHLLTGSELAAMLLGLQCFDLQVATKEGRKKRKE